MPSGGESRGSTHPGPLAERLGGQVAPAVVRAVTLLAIFASGALGAAASDPPERRFERLSIEEGLSQSTVHSIARDGQGLIWIGTGDGLNLYDGYEFTVRTYVPNRTDTLSGNAIYALREDADGRMWVGTWAGGLNRYDVRGDRFWQYRHRPDDPGSLASDRVFVIHLDAAGRLWIGMEGGALDRYDAESDAFEHFGHASGRDPELPPFAVRAIVGDGSGGLWVGTDGGGVVRLDAGGTAQPPLVHRPGDEASPSSNRITSLLADRRGALWIGTAEGGVDRYHPESGAWRRVRRGGEDTGALLRSPVTALHEDSEGVIWIGSNGEGLVAMDPDSGDSWHYRHRPGSVDGLSNDAALVIYEDRTGTLWIGTDGGGVSKALRGAPRFRTYRSEPADPTSLSADLVFSLFEDSRGHLWVGTWGGGLNRYDLERRRATHFRHVPGDPSSLPDDTVYALVEAADRLWVATGRGGLAALDPASGAVTGVWRHDPEDPASLASDRLKVAHPSADGTIWLGTIDAGLDRFDPRTGVLRHYGAGEAPGRLPPGRIFAVHEDRRGRLWVGVEGGGLNRLDPGSEAFIHYRHDPADPSGLGHDDVMTVLESRDGTIWVGTYGGGLDRWSEESDAFRHYRTEDGLPNNSVYGILEDRSGRLWLSTNRGLSRFDPATERFTNFDTSDGLQSPEFNSGAYFAAPSGEMLFGGIDGFSSFFPERIEANPHVPPLVLTAVKQHGETLVGVPAAAGLRELVFGPRETSFTLEFSALDYTAPRRNRYAYRMVGFDAGWIDAGTKRDVTYTNLDPGRYTFRVRGSNNDGVWNEEGIALAVIIRPPFWGTVWFRGGAILVLAGAAIGLHRLRLRAVRRRNDELRAWNRKLEAEVSERRRAEAQAERLIAELEAANSELTAFTSTVSHDLRAPLVTVQGFASKLQGDLASGDSDRAAHELTRIREAADHMRQLLDDLVELSRVGRLALDLEELPLEKLVRDALGIAAGTVREKGAQVLVRTPLPGVRCDRTRIIQVVQNLVENAVKFGEAGSAPRIEISAAAAGGTVTCTVRDNGRGIDPAYQERIFRLFEQLDPTTEGTGIGLTMVRKIVELHGGRIWVESAGPGRGASFHFTLPVAAIEPAAARETMAAGD